MKQDALNYINNTIMRQAANLRFIVKDSAPDTEQGLFNESSLVIWSGGSENTIYQDSQVNYAFRALHDKLHLDTGYNFTPQSEIALGRLQASKYSSGLLQDLIFCEVSLQAEYYLRNGVFVPDQKMFTLEKLGV